jgi:hypothetical protein
MPKGPKSNKKPIKLISAKISFNTLFALSVPGDLCTISLYDEDQEVVAQLQQNIPSLTSGVSQSGPFNIPVKRPKTFRSRIEGILIRLSNTGAGAQWHVEPTVTLKWNNGETLFASSPGTVFLNSVSPQQSVILAS